MSKNAGKHRIKQGDIKRGDTESRRDNKQAIGVWMDNPEYVAKLDECTTIDRVMRKVL